MEHNTTSSPFLYPPSQSHSQGSFNSRLEDCEEGRGSHDASLPTQMTQTRHHPVYGRPHTLTPPLASPTALTVSDAFTSEASTGTSKTGKTSSHGRSSSSSSSGDGGATGSSLVQVMGGYFAAAKAYTSSSTSNSKQL